MYNNAIAVREARAAEPVLLHEFFEWQARLRAEHPALECNGQSLTYSELDAQANRIAHLLRARGVRPGTLVALYLSKSPALFAGLLGVLKAGAGYIPLDTKFPIGRIQSIVEDSGAAIVLSERSTGEALASLVNAEIIYLDGDEVPGALPVSDIVAATPSDVCYVIYTSGSTGAPKGVLIEHRNAVNYIRAMQKMYGLDKDDRVYQGFSIAFDASVEEIWGAFSLGGTLVVPGNDIVTSPLDAADFITAQGITFFSTVPSFLALIKADLPSLKLLVVGGEVCSPDLVSRWAGRRRRMLNTYGPTEATVVTTVAECVPGAPVTIGRAMPGYETHVLDGNLNPVQSGECAELYIGGDSTARGYLNHPELTAERFISNPFTSNATAPSRLYRTFDLVRLAEDGSLQFIGRADGQVKIRGFRVELSEIEAVLMEHPAIQLAAANVVGSGASAILAAYVVLADTNAEIDRETVVELLRARVPEYMVPKYLDVLEKLPTAVSGKIDRKLLPPPTTLLSQSKRRIVLPQTALQRQIADAWEQILQVSPISIHDDFFLDLHGHSLAAARIVTELRDKLSTVKISVRNLYENRTIESLARYLDGVGVVAYEGAARETSETSESQHRFDLVQPPLHRTRWLCASLQFIGLLAFYGIVSSPATFATIMILRVLNGNVAWYVAANTATVVAFAIWPSWLAISVALKWIVIGRYKPGRYPVWGLYYFRWWLVSRFQSLAWSQMFIGTPLMSLYYRMMGAKIGRKCTIGTPICTAFDLVEIGDTTSIGTDTHLLGYRVEGGYLILGNVSIGRDCFIGTHCCIGLNTAMGDRARLDDMSLLIDGKVIAEGEGQRGSPASPADVQVPVSSRSRPRRSTAFFFGLIHLALIYVMGYILILSAVPAIALVGYALYVGGPVIGIAAAFAAVPVSILWYLQLVLLTKDIVIGRILPGIYSVYSIAYLRYWFLSYLLDNTRQIVLPLYATVFLPRFLRQLGAKVGRMVEISTVMHTMPDLLEIDDGSFLADACIVGGHRIYAGTIEIRGNKIGRRTFVGNSALVPAGIDLGDNGLVGVMSTPPAGIDRTPDGTRWLGSPGLELPGTQQVSCFTARQTFEPTYFLIIMRTLVDVFRVLLPGLTATASLVAFCAALVVLSNTLTLLETILLVPPIAVLLCCGSLLGVVGLKKILIGKFVPVQKPLWSRYVWFNEVINAQYETLAAAILHPFLGTPFIAPLMRMIGCKIGRWVFLESTLFSEFDLISIGHRASLNLGCTIQPHLFEDRIMKADTIEIGAGCTVGNMAVVLYDTRMHAGSSLGPLSVLMKGEGLPALTHWYGIPSQPMVPALENHQATGALVNTLQPAMPMGDASGLVPEDAGLRTGPKLAV